MENETVFALVSIYMTNIVAAFIHAGDGRAFRQEPDPKTTLKDSVDIEGGDPDSELRENERDPTGDNDHQNPGESLGNHENGKKKKYCSNISIRSRLDSKP